MPRPMTPRPWMGYLAGAALALCAGGAACAQAVSSAPSALPAAGDHQRIERRVVIRHREDQAEHLRTMLQLKPSQEPALAAYLAAVSPERHHEAIVEMSDRGDAKTTPQRLADMEGRLAEQTAQGHARIEATRKFYDQLEPSQKKVFDELPMLMIGPTGPMMNVGDMKVMVNMQGLPPMPPLPPLPPVPPAPRL